MYKRGISFRIEKQTNKTLISEIVRAAKLSFIKCSTSNFDKP